MASCSPPPPSRCRYCDAEIYWADENGHRVPVDVVPHPEGTKILRLQGGKIVCRTTFVGEVLEAGVRNQEDTCIVMREHNLFYGG